MSAILLRTTLAALAVLTLAGSSAEAQWGVPRSGGSAHNEGYRDGVRAGADDARDGRRYEYQRHRDYRQADSGWQGRAGRRNDYQQDYRAGFVAGYRDGFYSGNGRGRPSYGGAPFYDRGGRGVVDLARRNGIEDGYDKGFDDGRDRGRFDVRRHSRYRDADRGYRRDYGPRGVYQEAYRSAFERAYREGYEDGRRYRRR